MKNIYLCYPEGKHKALTMSYDDGKEADRRLIDIFNKNKIKATFHLNGGFIGQDYTDKIKVHGDRIRENEIKKLYEGHEVATHTYSHPTIERCPLSQVINQIVEDRKILESIVGYPVLGLSYPNGSYSDRIKEILPRLDIKYSRVVEDTGKFDLPKDLYEWKATCHHGHDLLKLSDEFLSLHKKQYLYLFYVWGHSYEFDRDNNWALIEEFAKRVGNRDDIWYATNIEIVYYLERYDKLRFSIDGSFVYNPSFESVWISVDDKIIEVKGGEQVSLR